MSDLIHSTPDLPSPDSGRTPSFLALTARVTALAASAAALAEGLHALRRRMDRDAADADRLAEMCAAAEVEPRFTALVHEAGAALRAVATASGEMAQAADQMAGAADGLAHAHEREYRGVYEAVQASGVRQARPGFYRTR